MWRKCMLEEDVVQWLYEGAQALLNGSTRMGNMEKALERASREVRRKALERLAQETADQQPFVCPTCKTALNVVEHHRARTVRGTKAGSGGSAEAIRKIRTGPAP
jgi:transcription initiation factor IIE alpha subunit